LVAENFAFYTIVYRFRNVCRVIADPLDILGTKQEVGVEAGLLGLIHHCRQQLDIERIVHRVDFLVALPNRERRRGIALRVGVEHVLELAHRSLADMQEACHDLLWMLLARDGYGTLGYVFRQIANAFEVACYAYGGYDLPKIAGNGLPPRYDRNRIPIDG